MTYHRALKPSPTVDVDAIEIVRLFPTPLASMIVPDHERLNAELATTILHRAATVPGVTFSNVGGWQSPADFDEWSGPAGVELVAFGRAYANELSAISTPREGLVHAALDWRTDAWANVNMRGDANAVHGHPGAYWSGVYWVDDGRDGGRNDLGGDLRFSDPRGIVPTLLSPSLHMRIEGCLGAGLTYTIRPESGTFVMFPSWLLHEVTRYEGRRKRISVAFNFAP